MLLPVYGTVFIDLFGFGIILPMLPYYAQSFGANGVWIGILLSAYSFAQFISAPILGRISDRVGRRPVLLYSLLGAMIAFTCTGLANTLPLLIAARFLAGSFGGSISSAQAYIADVSLPQERAKYMGLLGATIGLGFMFGPAVGALLSDFGFATASFVAAGLAGMNLIYTYFKLPESNRQLGTVQHKRGLDWVALSRAYSNPHIGRLLTGGFLVMFAFVAMEVTFALLMADRLKFTAKELGITFFVIGVNMVIVQGALVGRINPRLGDLRTVIVGGAFLCLSLIILPTVHSIAALGGVLAIMAFGNGLLGPTLSSMLSKAARVDEQGSVLGLGQGLQSLARAVSPMMAGWLYDVDTYYPYWFGAVLVAVAGVLVARLKSLPLPAQGT